MSRQTVESPCIRCCTLDDCDICVGCFRSLDEITGWQGMTDAQRRTTLARVSVRRAAYEKKRRHSKDD